MKKTLRKVLASLLVAAMVLICAPLSGITDFDLSKLFAVKASAEELAPTGQCGDDVYWTFDESTGTLTFSGTGNMWDFCKDGYSYNYWKVPEQLSPFDSNNEIREIVLGENITSIGDCSFCGCKGLTSITIPENITYIGGSAFADCANITNMEYNAIKCTIGGFIEDEGFWEFGWLESYYHPFSSLSDSLCVTVGENVKELPVNFLADCGKVAQLNLPKNIEGFHEFALAGCRIERINVSDIYTWLNLDIPWCIYSGYDNPSDVRDIYHVFNPLDGADLLINGKVVTELVIPEDVTEIKDFAFLGCKSIKK